jgi:hypothetical protein
MLERDIRKLLKDRVEKHGGEVRAVAWLGRRHAPDVLALLPTGKHPFIETKAPGGVPRDGQLREHERMRAAGCEVLVISTREQLDKWLPPA